MASRSCRPATTAGSGGTDTPPATTTDLRVASNTANSVTLNWTAPGDDGTVGTAYAYDLRQATVPITSQNFNLASELLEPSPSVAGSTERVTISNLSPGLTYYFALNTRDHTNHFSPISNVVIFTMPGGATATPTPAPTADRVAPAAPGGLRVN